MKSPWQIRGYCAVFNAWSCELDGDEPLRERIMPGAFCQLNGTLEANVVHSSAARVATTWDGGLKIWQDQFGLAFSIDLPATCEGLGTKAMVETGGVRECSFGLIPIEVKYFRDENGLLHRDVVRATIDHISLSSRAAYPTACWVASTPREHLTASQRAAAIRWGLGVIARDRKLAADRKMVANFLATPGASERFFAKAAG
jgi:HK97 family phage prohead protease